MIVQLFYTSDCTIVLQFAQHYDFPDSLDIIRHFTFWSPVGEKRPHKDNRQFTVGKPNILMVADIA